MWFGVHQNTRSLLCGMELGCIGNMCFSITLSKVDAATEICVQLKGTIFQSRQLNQCQLFHGVMLSHSSPTGLFLHEINPVTPWSV